MKKIFSDFRSTNLFIRFLKDVGGLAALEFAFIAPVMIILFFGVVEGSDAISASRRASLAVNTLADLVAQETNVSKKDAEDLFKGVESIIDPRGVDATFSLVSVVYDPDDKRVEVAWSLDSDGKEPYAEGSEYKGLPSASLLDDASSLIVGELEYEYSSTISQYVFSSIQMNKLATRWPRRSFQVEYCKTACTS